MSAAGAWLPLGATRARVWVEGGAPRRVEVPYAPSAAAADVVRRAAELATGAWIEAWGPGPWAWQATGLLLDVTLSPEQPTHRVAFAPDGGAPEVDLVRLDGAGGAPTHAERAALAPAAWRRDPATGVWTHTPRDAYGHPDAPGMTPGGRAGAVVIERLQK